jgi:hypothetical protein
LSDEDLKKLCELKTSYTPSLSRRGIENFLYDKVKEDCSIFPIDKGELKGFSIKKDIVYED